MAIIHPRCTGVYWFLFFYVRLYHRMCEVCVSSRLPLRVNYQRRWIDFFTLSDALHRADGTCQCKWQPISVLNFIPPSVPVRCFKLMLTRLDLI